MSKSVYSLVLDDEVVAAADGLAYQRNLSRSALINQLLAEALSCMTPERRNRSVFDAVEKWMQSSGLRMQMMPSESVLSIHSALSYKYNPRIRYAVELYRDSDCIGGELRVGFRSQNQALLQALASFFSVWMELEQAYLGARFPSGKIPCDVRDGRYRRRFLPLNAAFGCEEFGQAIAEYIRSFDLVLKPYFSELDSPQVLRKTEEAYRTALQNAQFII